MDLYSTHEYKRPERAGIPAAGQRRVPGLSTRSDDFRRRWGSHNVRIHGTGVNTFHHYIVGDLELNYESLALIAEPGLVMTIYAAERLDR